LYLILPSRVTDAGKKELRQALPGCLVQ